MCGSTRNARTPISSPASLRRGAKAHIAGRPSLQPRTPGVLVVTGTKGAERRASPRTALRKDARSSRSKSTMHGASVKPAPRPLASTTMNPVYCVATNTLSSCARIVAAADKRVSSVGAARIARPATRVVFQCATPSACRSTSVAPISMAATCVRCTDSRAAVAFSTNTRPSQRFEGEADSGEHERNEHEERQHPRAGRHRRLQTTADRVPARPCRLVGPRADHPDIVRPRTRLDSEEAENVHARTPPRRPCFGGHRESVVAS